MYRQIAFCVSIGIALAAATTAVHAQGYYNRPMSSASMSVRNYGYPQQQQVNPAFMNQPAWMQAGRLPSAYATNGTAQTMPVPDPNASAYAKQQYARAWQAPPLSGNPQAAELSTAVKRIADEAIMNKEQLQREGSYYQNNTQSAAQVIANQYINEGARVANSMRGQYYYTGRSGSKVAMYSPQDIAATQEQYQERANQVLAAAQRRGQAIQTEYSQRQESLLESAQNLQSQLTEKPAGSDSVMLQPVGTNLYVRNYQSIGEQYDKLPPVQPQNAVPLRGTYQSGDRPATNVGPGYANPYTDPAQATPEHYLRPANSSGIQTVVSGRLMRDRK